MMDANKYADELYQRLAERYAEGNVPWDDPLPPPEVVNHTATRPPGRALDLGCGYGRATIYLAGLGWDVDGVDFIAEATAEAAQRARVAGVYARFHIGEVTDLDFLAGPYDLAIDVGCCHNMAEDNLVRYRDQLERLVRPGGTFLLFARLREDNDPEENAGPGLRPQAVQELFATGFDLERAELGSTEVPGQSVWRSGWFWFRRT
jgi:cyclopropane fatty-acyl-phospholipid synthase-like methyltransferase